MTNTSGPARCTATMLALSLAASFAAHADVLVGAGSTVHFADARIDLGCGNLVVSGAADATSASLGGIASFTLAGGTFTLDAGTLALGGDFANAGSFAPGSGTVAVRDACGDGMSTFSGANDFYALTITTGVGKQVIFPTGFAQNVAHALTLRGAAGNLLRIASSVSGQQGVLALSAGGVQNIAYVDVRDNDATATPIAPGAAAAYQSVDSGDLTHWFDVATGGGNTPVPAPALNRFTLPLIAALIGVLAWRRRHAQHALFARHRGEAGIPRKERQRE